MRLIFIGGGKGAQIALRHFITKELEYGNQCGEPFYHTYWYVDDFKTDTITYGTNWIARRLGGVAELDSMNPHDSHLLCVVSRNMEFRREVFDKFRERMWVTMILSTGLDGVQIGRGNFVFRNVAFEDFCEVGDNNVISSGCIINHHNKIGSGNLLGPGCLFSGTVTVGDNCDIGAGVIVHPRVTIGNNCKIASGSIITANLPDGARVIAPTDHRNGTGVYQGDRIVRTEVA